jgi:hypothetical protein
LAGLANPASDGVRRETNGRMKMARAFLNIVLDLRVIGFLAYALGRTAIFLIGASVK